METDIVNVLYNANKAFFQSNFFHYIQIIAGFIIVILLIADILLLSKRMQGDISIALYGSKTPRFKKSKYTKRWEDIKKGVEGENTAAGKISVIKADEMLGEILKKVGYKGKDTGEMIASVKPGQLSGIEDIIDAHEIYKRIVRDPAYQVEMNELRAALGGYEKVFRGLELLD